MTERMRSDGSHMQATALPRRELVGRRPRWLHGLADVQRRMANTRNLVACLCLVLDAPAILDAGRCCSDMEMKHEQRRTHAQSEAIMLDDSM